MDVISNAITGYLDNFKRLWNQALDIQKECPELVKSALTLKELESVVYNTDLSLEQKQFLEFALIFADFLIECEESKKIAERIIADNQKEENSCKE